MWNPWSIRSSRNFQLGLRVTHRIQHQIERAAHCALFLSALCLVTLVPQAHAQNYRSPLILSPYSLEFARVLVGKPSGSQSVIVFNNGGSPQPVSSIAITGEFSETDDCPKSPDTLAIQAACEIKITFKPSGVTPSSGTLTVGNAASNTQLVVNLTGTGTAGKPTATISPASLAFPDQKMGVESPIQTVTVTNTGTETLNILSLQVQGDFLALPTSTCSTAGTPLAPNATCTVQLAFSPVATGQRTGELSVEDNAEDSPQKVTLHGGGK